MKLVKKEFTKLVMEITSVLIRSYYSKVAPSPATTPFDSFPIGVSHASAYTGFDPRQWRHLIRAHLVYQLIRVQLVLLD